MNEHPDQGRRRIFPVYLGSNELSPFHGCYADAKTVLRFAAGRSFVHDNGEDPEIAYWALRRTAALFDVPERAVEIRGPDAAAFLERLCTRRVSTLAIGRGRYVLMCTPDGGLFMDGIVFRLAEDRFWFVQPDGELNAWLLAHRGGYDVAISDPNSRVLQLQGPQSFAIMNAVSGGAIDETLGYFGCGFFSLAGQEVLVSRTGWTGELGYEIHTMGADTDCATLWSDLMRAGRPMGLTVGAMRAMNIRRIKAGIPDSGSDFDATLSPGDVGLGRFVDRDHRGYIGEHAVLARQESNRLFGLRNADVTPSAGDEISLAGRRVARVTTGAHSPCLQAGIGYAIFDAVGDWAGRTLVLRTFEGAEAPCTILSLPFYDTDKRLPGDLPYQPLKCKRLLGNPGRPGKNRARRLSARRMTG